MTHYIGLIRLNRVDVKSTKAEYILSDINSNCRYYRDLQKGCGRRKLARSHGRDVPIDGFGHS